ncbi:glucan synthesis regulatory protein [Histoplasma capsulatum]|uniref:Glucan synthesis regulatory protein n=1 Tax=Ajellomyces capsulatus TaxID=5037 RepID=A0A8A1MH83_AJECA|nr:glucan synthesis regulatory protein [Histoplasma capsulatum]
MASSLGSAFRSFWHTMTSNDRHASHDSPYRTGQHVPLSQNRNAPLTSVATSAAESRADLSFEENPAKRSSSPAWSGSHGGVTSPVRPYSPGMRSLSSQQRRSNELSSSDGVAPTEIQMQSFHAGAPPPPPVSHSWKKIDQWAESNYEELYDQLCEGCSQNDVNELEHELDCTLPLEVRESLQIHDGQERGGRPTGIIFGCMLLDCEEIVQEWKNWRTVNEEFLSTTSVTPPQPPMKAFGGSSAASSSSAPPPPPPQIGSNPLWRQELLDKQDSQPPKAIQKAYAHPSWIPLARDWGGNNIAVDLAPGPAGKWGQVIIFGPAGGDERGRSPHRFPTRGPNASPKTGFGVSSPLARVTEETTSPVSPDSNNNKIDGTASLNSDATKNPNGVADAASSTTTTTSTTTTATASSDTSKSDVTTDDPPETGLSAAPPKEKEKEKHKRRSNLTSPRSSTGLDADALEGMKSIAI